MAGTGVRNAFKRRQANPTFAAAWDAAVAVHRSELGRQAMKALADEGLGAISGPAGGKLILAGQSHWSKRSEETFLMELTASGSVRLAAKAAGFSTSALYKRRLRDRHLAAAWDAAVETGRARLQAHLVEAANRTFDPEELPVGDAAATPAVSVSEAINIAKLGGSAAGRAGKGRWDEEDGQFVTDEELEAARTRIFERMARIEERIADHQLETGCCHACGQPLPEVPLEETQCSLPKAAVFLYGDARDWTG